MAHPNPKTNFTRVKLSFHGLNSAYKSSRKTARSLYSLEFRIKKRKDLSLLFSILGQLCENFYIVRITTEKALMIYHLTHSIESLWYLIWHRKHKRIAGRIIQMREKFVS